MNKYGVVYSFEGTHLSTFAEMFNKGQFFVPHKLVQWQAFA